MQMNENVVQTKPVARLQEMVGAPIAQRPMLATQAKRPDVAPRAAVGTNRNRRRFGAGF